MTKAKSITVLVIISILIILATVFAFVSFDMGETKEYHGFLSTISLGLDLSGGVYAVYEVDPTDESYASKSDNEKKAAIEGTASTMEAILFGKGFTEAQVSVLGSTIRVEVPDVDDPSRIFDLIGRPASLWLQGSDSQLQSSDSYDKNADGMSGSDIESAGVVYHNESGQYAVALKFNSKGTTRFSELTSTYSGKYIAMFVNKELLICPSVNSQISDGECTISSSQGYSYEQAYELSVQIMAGSFQTPLTQIESGVISATLGSTAILAGIISGGVGLALIVIYLIVLYRLMGVAASLALVYYTLTYLFFLAIFPWVQLTLSGIAGVLLSIGMAVDANVIIFERIKEEYGNGKTMQTACSIGFKRSLGAILDGNITTIIGAVVLIIVGSFGAAALKGFGITLLIGIILSLLSSLLLTRLLLACVRALTGNGDNVAKMYALKRKSEDEVFEEDTAPAEVAVSGEVK